MSDLPDVWTVLRIINWSEGFLRKKGIESPRVDVELLQPSRVDNHGYGRYGLPLREGTGAFFAGLSIGLLFLSFLAIADYL